jgi:hypothetical protein
VKDGDGADDSRHLGRGGPGAALVLRVHPRKHGDWKGWLLAARFESAHRLGRPEQAGRLAEADIRALESDAFTEEWGRRIAAASRR